MAKPFIQLGKSQNLKVLTLEILHKQQLAKKLQAPHDGKLTYEIIKLVMLHDFVICILDAGIGLPADIMTCIQKAKDKMCIIIINATKCGQSQIIATWVCTILYICLYLQFCHFEEMYSCILCFRTFLVYLFLKCTSQGMCLKGSACITCCTCLCLQWCFHAWCNVLREY